MKVSRQDIDDILSAYEREKILFSRNFTREDYKTIAEISDLRQTISSNPDDNLTPVELYQFCKILLHCQRPINAVTQFCNKLGLQFQCLEFLMKNDLFNWHYFTRVIENKLDLATLKKSFHSTIFCKTRDLLTRVNILTAEILDWLMELDEKKLSMLHEILETLDSKQALHEKFFPLFFYFDESNKKWNCCLDKADLNLYRYSFTSSEYQEVFEAFVAKIKTSTLKKIFDEVKEIWKIPYPGGIGSIFIKLIRCKLLTVDRFNAFIRTRLSTLSGEIDFVDALLGALHFASRESDYYTEVLATVNKHFELLLKFLSFENAHNNPPVVDKRNHLIAYRNIEIIREHPAEFETLNFVHHPDLCSLYRGIVHLHTESLLSSKTLSAICGENSEVKASATVALSEKLTSTKNQPSMALTGNQLPVALINNQQRVELTDTQLFVIKNHPDPYYLLSLISSMEQPALEEHFNKMATDIEEIIMKAKALPELQLTNTSYFFRLPRELLPLLAVTGKNDTINTDQALQIYNNHVIKPSTDKINDVSTVDVDVSLKCLK